MVGCESKSGDAQQATFITSIRLREVGINQDQDMTDAQRELVRNGSPASGYDYFVKCWRGIAQNEGILTCDKELAEMSQSEIESLLRIIASLAVDTLTKGLCAACPRFGTCPKAVGSNAISLQLFDPDLPFTPNLPTSNNVADVVSRQGL